MRMSESLINMAPALLEAQKSLGNVKANSKNPMFKSSYVPLDDFIHEARAILNKNDISIIQSTFSEEGRVGARTMLIHKSGEFIESDGASALVELSTNREGKATNSYGQAAGSLVTYFRRYDGFAILGIAETDNDAHVAKEEVECVGEPELKTIRELMVKSEANEGAMLKFYKVSRLEDLPLVAYASVVDNLNKKIKTAPETKTATTALKDAFDKLITDENSFDMYIMQRTVGPSAFTDLYHTFPKGQKGKYQKVVQELIDKGQAEFEEYCKITAEGHPTQDEVSVEAWELIKQEIGE